MSWNLDKNRAICPQIFEKICVDIASGKLPADSKISSVREVAVEAGVNPNTVQKSFELLEKEGLIYSVRSSGWFVKDTIAVAKKTVEKLLKQKTELYFKEMAALGLDQEFIKSFIKEWDE